MAAYKVNKICIHTAKKDGENMLAVGWASAVSCTSLMEKKVLLVTKDGRELTFIFKC